MNQSRIYVLHLFIRTPSIYLDDGVCALMETCCLLYWKSPSILKSSDLPLRQNQRRESQLSFVLELQKIILERLIDPFGDLNTFSTKVSLLLSGESHSLKLALWTPLLCQNDGVASSLATSVTASFPRKHWLLCRWQTRCCLFESHLRCSWYCGGKRGNYPLSISDVTT